MLHTERKTLLIRADFALGKGPAIDPHVYKYWQHVLADALPRLLACQRRCPGPARVRLHLTENEARFTGWLRIPIQRRPGRKRVRKFKERLRTRLEQALLPINGRLLKLGVRRCRPRPPLLPLLAAIEQARSA